MGIHPNSCAEAAADDWDRLVALADHPRVVAVGETGLDRYWDFAPLELQIEYFRRHLRLGGQRELPVIIHCRDAAADLMPLLEAAAAAGPVHGLLHAFSGDAAMAAKCLELGLSLSFAGNVTYRNKKFEPLRAAAAAAPADRILDRDRLPLPDARAAPRQAAAERAGAWWSTRPSAWPSCGACRRPNSPPRPRPTPGDCSASSVAVCRTRLFQKPPGCCGGGQVNSKAARERGGLPAAYNSAELRGVGFSTHFPPRGDCYHGRNCQQDGARWAPRPPIFRCPTPAADSRARRFRRRPALLVIFLCNHCPYVKHVADSLAALVREYQERGVAVVGINANDVRAAIPTTLRRGWPKRSSAAAIRSPT